MKYTGISPSFDNVSAMYFFISDFPTPKSDINATCVFLDIRNCSCSSFQKNKVLRLLRCFPFKTRVGNGCNLNAKFYKLGWPETKESCSQRHRRTIPRYWGCCHPPKGGSELLIRMQNWWKKDFQDFSTCDYSHRQIYFNVSF